MSNKINLIEHLQDVLHRFKADFDAISIFPLVINHWIDILVTCSVERRMPAVSKFQGTYHEETFTHTVEFPGGKEFMFEWDVVYAMDWMKKRSIEKRRIDVRELTPYIRKNETDFSKPERKLPQHPIIVIPTCFANQGLIVINGNHRIVEAMESGIRQIEGFFIRNERHREWMMTEEMRAYYEFLMDFACMERGLQMIQNGETIDKNVLFNSLNVSKRIGKAG